MQGTSRGQHSPPRENSGLTCWCVLGCMLMLEVWSLPLELVTCGCPGKGDKSVFKQVCVHFVFAATAAVFLQGDLLDIFCLSC